jgi:hypothetical protein
MMEKGNHAAAMDREKGGQDFVKISQRLIFAETETAVLDAAGSGLYAFTRQCCRSDKGLTGGFVQQYNSSGTNSWTSRQACGGKFQISRARRCGRNARGFYRA